MPLGSYVLNGLAKSSVTNAVGLYVQNSVTSVNTDIVTIPTILDGDVGIFFASCTTTGNAGTVPTGWTNLFSGSLNYSYRISYKTLTSAESGTTISSGLTTGTRSNILLIVRGLTSSAADAVIPSYAFSTPLGQTTIATPNNQIVEMTVANQGVLGFGMWASNGTITARGFAGYYGNTPSTPQLTEYSSNATGINLYVKALSSFPNLSGGTTSNQNIYNQRDSITYSMNDYGSNGTAVFYMQLNQSSGSRTAYPIYSTYKVNSPALTTSNFKFGSASLNVPLSVSPIKTNASYFTPGTSPYTVEWWGYQTSNPTNNPGWFDMNPQTTSIQSRPLVYFVTSTTLRVILNGANVIASISTPTLNNWHHYALVREGTAAGQLKFYIDGVLSGTGTDGSTYSAWSLTIGGLVYGTSSTGAQSGPFLIDEFRVSSVARYTGAFTPPTAAFVNDANTKALYHFDGVDGTYYFPDDNA